jgi:hypothetical protein
MNLELISVECPEYFQGFSSIASEMSVFVGTWSSANVAIPGCFCNSGGYCSRVLRVPGERRKYFRGMVNTILHPSYNVFHGFMELTSSLQRYIRDAILRAAAVAFKRLSLSLTYNATPQILSLVQNLADQNSSIYSVMLLCTQLIQKIVFLSCLKEYLDTFIPSQTTKQTTFHLPLEQHIHSKAELDSKILQPLWITLTQVLEHCLSQSSLENDNLIQKAVICCETIISWNFGIEEGTFRRVSFGPATAVTEDDDIDDEKQPIWPGSWGNVINEFVVNLFFKVNPLQVSKKLMLGLWLDAE